TASPRAGRRRARRRAPPPFRAEASAGMRSTARRRPRGRWRSRGPLSSGAPLNFVGHVRAGFGRACAHETALRRRHNRGATNGPKLGVGPAHDRKSPDPVLQRSKFELAFAHIIGETEADPLPAPRTGAMHPNWLIFAAEIRPAARSPPA